MRIAGYTYSADLYCGDCIVPLAAGDPDYWHVDAEAALDDLAIAQGIDRYDERSFDSDDFPKVVFADSLGDSNEEGGIERCGGCGEVLA